MDYESLRFKLIAYLIAVSSLVLHEWGHAATADRLGDDTPRRMGRVTLNPLVHIDLIGTVLLPLLGVFTGIPLIGWAKPVLINPSNLPRTADRAWVTIAGPGMNLILAVAAVFALAFAVPYAPSLKPLFSLLLVVNVGLMVFNLLPIPPLDGSKFLMYWGGMSETAYENFARFGWIILMVGINLPFTRDGLSTLIDLALTPFSALLHLLA